MSNLDFLARVQARNEANDLGLPWPGRRGQRRDMLDDALGTGGIVWFDPPLSQATHDWRVTSVLDCDTDGHCIAVIAVESASSGHSMSGQHLPLGTKVWSA